jgi:nucleolar pre-ribosomal-associated protein 1
MVQNALEEDIQDGQWAMRRSELQREMRKRVPDPHVIIAFSQQRSEASKTDSRKPSMLSEAAHRLLWLYHSCLPDLMAEINFDVGKLLLSSPGYQAIQVRQVENNEHLHLASIDKVTELHALRLLSTTEQFQWTGRACKIIFFPAQ